MAATLEPVVDKLRKEAFWGAVGRRGPFLKQKTVSSCSRQKNLDVGGVPGDHGEGVLVRLKEVSAIIQPARPIPALCTKGRTSAR